MANHQSFPPRMISASSSSSLQDMPSKHPKLRLLVAATGTRDTSWAQALVVRLSKNPRIEMRAIVDDMIPRLSQTILAMENRNLTLGSGIRADDVDFFRQQAYELVEWADLLVSVPLDADSIAKMLAGIADTFLGEVLRGWDNRKSIILVPGMSTHMWSHPMTKRQLSKLHRKWSWIRTVTPILWHYEGQMSPKRVPNWSGFNEVLGIINNQVELLGLGRDVEIATGTAAVPDSNVDMQPRKLPPEIWTLVLQYVGDWELAKALGVYTNLHRPYLWSLKPKDASDPLQVYKHELEWTVLTANSAAICRKLSQSPPNFRKLPDLAFKLIIRFALIDVLTYMEINRPELFEAFDGTTLPIHASVHYPQTAVLDFWKSSIWFSGRHVYGAESMDGASSSGFVDVLDWWWRHSDMPLRYTEAALEEASKYGHVPVLEWWRQAAAQSDIVLRPGRSLIWASQFGHNDVLEWWHASGIPVAHGDLVAKMASRWGHVEVLETWRRAQGDDKLVFDAEVLLTSTIYQHVDVLEWWRKFAHGELEGMEGRRHPVEFRTCNIEEALEDSIDESDNHSARKWWAQYGLDLGMRNEEWLETRYL